VPRLEKDFPELLSFFHFPGLCGASCASPTRSNAASWRFCRTRPMVCFVNVESVDRIIYAIFNGLNENVCWKSRTLRLFTQAA
jgi:hypothetical protein